MTDGCVLVPAPNTSLPCINSIPALSLIAVVSSPYDQRPCKATDGHLELDFEGSHRSGEIQDRDGTRRLLEEPAKYDQTFEVYLGRGQLS